MGFETLNDFFVSVATNVEWTDSSDSSHLTKPSHSVTHFEAVKVGLARNRVCLSIGCCLPIREIVEIFYQSTV